MPEVSVIIPNYNHKRYLLQRIESVLGQTFQDIEVIILDDCSTDGSEEIIEQYRTNRKVADIIYNKTNSGSTFKQWEKGIRLARGEWVWIAESDDYCENTFLKTLLKLAEAKQNVGIAFANSYWVDDGGLVGEELSIYKESFFREGTDEVKELSKHCTIQNASSCIIKRGHALQAVQGLSKYKACGDWIFYTRVLQNSNLVYINSKLNYFRWYHNNVSSKAKEKLWITEGVDVLRNINYSKVFFTPGEFSQLIKGWVKKVKQLSLKDGLGSWMTIVYSVFKFYTSGKREHKLTNETF